MLGIAGVVLTFVLGCIAIKVLRGEIFLSVLNMVFSSITATIVALIPMIIGLGSKSVIWIIVSSILLAAMLLGNIAQAATPIEYAPSELALQDIESNIDTIMDKYIGVTIPGGEYCCCKE